eukprot:529507_1
MSPFRYVIFISILLSQKIGTGKTTKIRSLLSSVNDNPNNASYQEPLRPIIIKNQVSLRIAVGNDLTSTCNKNLMNNASVINAANLDDWSSDEIPPITVNDYLSVIKHHLRVRDTLLVDALILMNRFVNNTFCVNYFNVHRLFGVATFVVYKAGPHLMMDNVAAECLGMDLEELVEMQQDFLSGIKNDTGIKDKERVEMVSRLLERLRMGWRLLEHQLSEINRLVQENSLELSIVNGNQTQIKRKDNAY